MVNRPVSQSWGSVKLCVKGPICNFYPHLAREKSLLRVPSRVLPGGRSVQEGLLNAEQSISKQDGRQLQYNHRPSE